MKKGNSFKALSYQELQASILKINYSSSINTHIILEQIISSCENISEGERIILISSLFIASLRKEIYHPDYILPRLSNLIIPTLTKHKIISLVRPTNGDLAPPKPKTVNLEDILAEYQIRSSVLYHYTK